MRYPARPLRRTILLLALAAVPAARLWAADIEPDGTKYKVLHRFTGSDGFYPHAGLIEGLDGKLWGTTLYGGVNGVGNVFRMSFSGQVSVRHSFADDHLNGYEPYAPLLQASDGNFYGTTFHGGSDANGTVYKLTPGGTFTRLHTFLVDGVDGTNPRGGLVDGGDGYFYGTTQAGGTAGQGTIYRISPTGKYKVMHHFEGGSADGAYPYAGLIRGIDGNFYGTTYQGGPVDSGVIFRMTPNGAVSVKHALAAGEGYYMTAALLQASDGNFYGTASGGGVGSAGTVFRMKPNGQFDVIHDFIDDGTDGLYPYAPLIQATDGNFYGTTFGGGLGYGTAFRMKPSGQVTVLHAFEFGGLDGNRPYSPLMQASNLMLYGTCYYGAYGTVYRLKID